MLRGLSTPDGPDVLVEVLGLFAADLPDRIASLDSALSSGDAAQAERAAHAVKGAAGNIGARALADVCRSIEDAAREGRMDGARATAPSLHDESQRVLEAIRQLLA